MTVTYALPRQGVTPWLDELPLVLNGFAMMISSLDIRPVVGPAAETLPGVMMSG